MRLLVDTHVFLWYIKQREVHGIATLPVEEAALVHLASLPSLHRDPFDRILIAQSMQHGLILATVDEAVRAYSLPLLPTK